MHQDLKARKISARELIGASLDAVAARDAKIGAFLSVRKTVALQVAADLDAALANGQELELLTGLPYALKDNILLKGEPCTAASRILEPYVATYNATVVRRLKAAGAICIGKTNLDEFAMGSSTEHSAYKATRNPIDPTRVPGGSSGGSAAAVAADLVPFALGSDTGGSIRQPASFCGVVGFKPSYGAVSRFGLMAMASSFDQIGALAHSVEDVAIVLKAMAGKDPFDATSHDSGDLYNPADYTEEARLKQLVNLRIGVPREFLPNSLSPAMRLIIDQAAADLALKGAAVEAVSLPLTPYALPVYYVTMPAEASSNLARYDGIRYQLSKPGATLQDVYLKTRAAFGEEVQRRILFGTFALSSGYYDAYYGKAKAVQAAMTQDYLAMFEKVDILVTPTCPTPAFKFGEYSEDPVEMYLSDIFTVTANLVGAPAISIPGGLVDGLPAGLQIMGKPGDDAKILRIAAAFELILGGV